jgi:hypothetical protein
MTDFEQIKIDIINQLNNMTYKVGDIDDIGNEIGIAIGKYTMLKNAEEIGTSKNLFICGLEHGISLIDGTH